MKKYCYLLFCLTATLLACDNGIFSDDDKPAPVSLDYPADPIAPEGGSISMTIRATGRWTVSKTTSWLTVTPAAGVGEQTVTISAPSNKVEKKDTPNRKTRIYIIAGAFTETIDVVQSGYLQPTPQAPQVSKSEQPCMTTISIAAPVEHAVAYKWYCDSVETLTDTTLTFEVIQSGTHSYAVAGVNITGNVGEWSEAVEITTSVCQPPQEGIGAITGEDANSCSVATGKNTVTLTAPKIPYAAGYLWYLDGALVDSGASKTFTARSSGTYTVRGANSEGTSGLSPGKTVTITPCPLTVEDLVGAWQTQGYFYRNEYNAITHRAFITKTGETKIKIQDFLKLSGIWSQALNDFDATVELTHPDTLTVSIAASRASNGGIYTGSTSTILAGWGTNGSCSSRNQPVVGKLTRGTDELVLDFSVKSATTKTISGTALYPCLHLLGINTDTDYCVGGGYDTYGLKLTRAYR